MLSRAEDNDEGVCPEYQQRLGTKNLPENVECWEICYFLSYSNDGISYEIIKVFPCMRLKF